MRRTVLLLLAVALVALVSPASASALATPRWKSSRITYRDATKSSIDRAALRAAVRWWNAVPGPLTFVKVTGRANITVRTGSVPGADFDGEAFFETDASGTFLTTASVELNDDLLAGEDPEYVAEVAAHELGHAFGLPHLGDKCSLMYTDGSVATRCPRTAGPRSPGRSAFYCGPQRSDVRSLLARYPGSLGNWPGTICKGAPPR
jgi:hypothetical protein